MCDNVDHDLAVGQ